MMARGVKLLVGLATLLVAVTASAQLYPKQNVNGPVPPYRQDAFPYPGQCTSNPANAALVNPAIPACTGIPAAPALPAGAAVTALNPALQTKWQFEAPNPVDYTAETTTWTRGTCSITTTQTCGTGLPACPATETCVITTTTQSPYDYYELSIAPAKNVQAAASLCVFPDPKFPPNATTTPTAGHTCYVKQTAGAWVADPNGIPQGTQWTGIVDPTSKKPLYTPVWGFGQINKNGGPLAALAGVQGNNVDPVVVTWPSMNLRGTKGQPMIVKFVNQLGNTHLFCPYPLAWDWPCAIDRTLMGVKATIDPTRASVMAGVPTDQVNAFGSPQQPDNAFTIHYHGGEIPPQSDGFAEKWFGNAATGAAYSPAPTFVDPAYESPWGTIAEVMRPGGSPAANPWTAYDRMTYYYPMVNDESLLWYHDHALGKTRINVAAGPAGFSPVEDKCNQVPTGIPCPAGCTTCSNAFAWLNPLRVKNAAGIPTYDLFLALQDRAFNSDGTINYPNGLGQPVPQPPLTPGMTPVTIGNNPQVHPQWVGEYFADHMTVNGVIWPKITVAQGVYRIRLLNGSNARCYQLGLGTKEAVYATAANAGKVTTDIPITVLADEQGYLPAPVVIPANMELQMCPGERYEILVDFRAFPAGTSIWMSNIAPAPFPVGISPQQRGSIFAHMASVIRFDISATPGVVVTSPWTAAAPNPLFTNIKTYPPCPTNAPLCTSATRQVYLNERIDPVTLTSLGLQINGVPFEYKVSETPKAGTYERWDIINTTGDFHPMHLHLVKFQTIQRESYNINGFTSALCGSNNCQIFGGGAGGMMQVVPDVTPWLNVASILPPNPEEAGWKDTVQAPPGLVTSVIARWDGTWNGAHGTCTMNFPGVEAYVSGATYNPSAPLCFEPVTNAPYVWHCHIVDHEDAEMMRSTLVIP